MSNSSVERLNFGTDHFDAEKYYVHELRVIEHYALSKTVAVLQSVDIYFLGARRRWPMLRGELNQMSKRK